MGRRYYSVRMGKTSAEASLPLLRRLFLGVYQEFERRGFFAEAFGFDCVDAGFVPGSAGQDLDLFFARRLRKEGLFPIPDKINRYSEEDLFDVVELLFDHVSRPTKGQMHSYGECGMHWSEFDRATGREEFRRECNELIADYGTGFELTIKGEIRKLAPEGLTRLVDRRLPKSGESVQQLVEEAVELFTSRHSKVTDRRNAVRMLADCLERLRPKLAKVLDSKDESDLFNIANNFAIRHNNDKQRREYDPIWLSWMFYFYLATIHAISHRLAKNSP